ncbi:MAG: SpvB/TcaC N-terminal domain-containing protein [Sandaracinus sp.]
MTSRAATFASRFLAATVATLLAWSPVTPYLARAQDHERPSVQARELAEPAVDVAVREELAATAGAEGAALEANVDPEAIEAEAAERFEEHADAEGGQTDIPRDSTPISLPGAETPSAVSPQSISLPTAEGSIQGMGESFSPVLSSGTATFSVPIAVAPGRAGVQPSLSLAYSTSGGNGPVGFGWGLGVPFISRQTDRGLPRYLDRAAWHPEEDRFIYNGGQELVPVDTAAMGQIDDTAAGSGDATQVPSDVVGWQQYRARVEGGFMRFFRAPPDARGQVPRWIVQSKDGTRFDFGLLPTGDGASDAVGFSPNALESDPESGTRVFRWMLTRMSDAHGSTVYYRYDRDRGQIYLADVYYVSPASCASASPDAARRCAQPTTGYGAHVHLVYESRDDAFTSYLSGYPITTGRRLHRVEVTAYHEGTGTRTLVRRYHLAYEDGYHSLLHSVQVEGRPQHMVEAVGVLVGDPTVAESSLGETVVGALLPPMTFGYSSLPDTSGAIAGFGGLSGTVRAVASSPPHSIDDALTDFFDVNSDGLPDLIVTDPARYRTDDGRPAVGVFFNGFSGADARPGTPGSFSGAVPMPMRSDLSGVLSLTNLNIVPMDIDGDGRSDLLHMPRVRSYGWFAPTRESDPAGAAQVSPADQGWRWTYATIDLPSTDLDPRIDFGRDSSHFEILDVNQDHLVDVIRSTGTSIQTWLNLGWIPERDAQGRGVGDGRFGTASYSGGHWSLSTQPTTSCLLTAGTPLDFADGETRLADMNGDGLVDLVRLRQGRVIWWPSRGVGSYGVGNHDCPSGFADGRYVEMQHAPTEINAELAGVQLADVDGDGATDLVQVRFDAIDVWFSRAGTGFTDRFIVRGTPPAPDYLPRVRLMDIDGSGTLDAVYASAGHYQYVDLLEHTQPRMLTTVDNGLGALTTIGYDTSVTDYLGDLQAASTTCTSESAGCDRFTWSRIEGGYSQRLQRRAPGEPTASMFHAAGTPVISTVVRSIRTSDRFGTYVGSDQVSETRFGYHEGYYEGIEQEFRGFGAADSITVGDASSPSVLTRTWFHQGRRPQDIADDRLAFNPDEALKGREYLTEVLDERGVYLSTAHATLTSRTLATGLDGRPIQYAFVSQSDEIRYDTTGYTPASYTATLPEVVRESVNASGAVTARTTDRSRDVRVRGERAVRIETTYDEVDNLGQVRRQTAHGRVNVLGTILPTDDPPITSVTVPVLVNGAAWIWRTHQSYVLDADGTTPLRDTTNEYSSSGDLLSSSQAVTSTRTYDFSNPTEEDAQGGADELTQTNEGLTASTAVDYWGQPVASCVGSLVAGGVVAPVTAAPATAPPTGCLRYSVVARDAQFHQLALAEFPFVARASLGYLDTHGEWDRGLGVLVSATDPNDLETHVTYDGLGRLTAVTPPASTAAGCATTPTPTTRIRYELTSSPASQPASRVVTTTELDCDGTLGEATTEGNPGSLTSIGYVDGLGRVRATLATGGTDAAWVRSGLTRLNAKGAAIEAWQSDYYGGSDTAYASVLQTPGESFPHTRSIYDAFGRVRVSYAEDGSLTSTSYHTLSTDVCDPLDNDPSSMHFGTCTTARTDGHGRLIDQILRNRQPGVGGTEYHRLWTWYRNDGAVTDLVRMQTEDGSQTRTATPAGATAKALVDHGRAQIVHRAFFYDSVGRRIGSDDPDTDDRSNPAVTSRTWRYLFNRAGDLAAVRDPRGCGQNFFYDLGGRLVGEQYVACTESQSSRRELPIEVVSDPIGMTAITGTRMVDVHYYYDDYPSWIVDSEEHEALAVALPASNLVGRATGVVDRAQRAAVAYDDRGNAVWTARQVAVISAPLASGGASTLSGASLPSFDEQLPTSNGTVVYDQQHTYIRTAVFDHAGRPTTMALPRDPNWDGTTGITSAPLVTGALTYNARGLPATASLAIGASAPIPIVRAIHYLRDGLVDSIEYGQLGTDHHAVVTSGTEYDQRRRPIHMTAARQPTDITGLGAVTAIADQHLVWDAASNLTAIMDGRDPAEWPEMFRPQSVAIEHDSLYRVVGALFDYSLPGDAPGSTSLGVDTSSDWRDDALASNAVDPMHPEPAPMATAMPETRVQWLGWEWDWLGNMTQWTDDQQQFYERSIGEITNGFDVDERPSALSLAAHIDPAHPAQSGWAEVGYGVGGNVTALTVYGHCGNAPSHTCTDPGPHAGTSRLTALHAGCTCELTQRYEYRWDELNRIAEARRFDRGAVGNWTFEARQRYRYDGANVRVVKQAFDTSGGLDATDSRVALYVYPGDFERRGLERAVDTYVPADTAPGTETQYLVAGARIVWDQGLPPAAGTALDQPHRITIPVSDLLHTTSASVDLWSGELLEVSTYYPNGARETLWAEGGGGAVPLEPMGFTGKEADEDVGLVYFGERYLIARLGRWASPDPLELHGAAGTRRLNSYHYVSGSPLQSRDMLGLCGGPDDPPCPQQIASAMTGTVPSAQPDMATVVGDVRAGIDRAASWWRSVRQAVTDFVFDRAAYDRSVAAAGPRVSHPVLDATDELVAATPTVSSMMMLEAAGALPGAGGVRAAIPRTPSALGHARYVASVLPVVRALPRAIRRGMARRALEVIEHADGSVSVGLSGGSPMTAEQIAAIEEALNASGGRYRVSDSTATARAPASEPGAPPAGACSEWWCAAQAGESASPPVGRATIWRGRTPNPHPLAGGAPDEMLECATCGANGDLLGEVAHSGSGGAPDQAGAAGGASGVGVGGSAAIRVEERDRSEQR